MPVYEYECPSLHRTEIFCRIGERPSSTDCSTCGAVAERVISPCVVVGAGEEHFDDNLVDARDKQPFLVKSRAHKRQRLKDLGLVQKEPTREDREKHAAVHRRETGRLTVQMR